MREHEPGLTVRKAKEYLEKEGIRISVKGIWGIWERYGYAGFSRRNMAGAFTDCSWTKEASKKYESAKLLFDRGSVDRAAEILNSIPALPENELLLQIPDSLLNMRRRIEKIVLLFGKIPVGSYLERLRASYKDCYSRNLYYSALTVGLVKTMALSWSGEPVKMLEGVEELRNILKKNRNYFSYLLFAPRLSLLISEGFAYTELLKIKEASDIAKTCRKLLKRRKYVSPLFMRHLGQLYTQLEDFREAEYWYSKSLYRLGEDEDKATKFLLTNIFVVKGEYKKALNIWKDEKLDCWGSCSKRLCIQSVWALTKGMPQRAISLTTEAVALFKTEEVKRSTFDCYLTIASAYCSLGEKAKATCILKRILPFLVKNRLENVKTIIEILLSHISKSEYHLPVNEDLLPTFKLALLLKNGQYAKALKYTEQKRISGLLYQYVFFFPELITELLKKGESTGLPRTMLNLPVFRKEIPVYSVKFLGNLIIYKNQKILRVQADKKKTQIASSDKFGADGSISLASRVRQTSSNGAKLTPKDTAFLIHLATLKNRHIALDRIYSNLWPGSKNPARNLAHLLVRIRKALCLPAHFLYIKYNTLHFDCYFITDYGEYLEHLAQAKAFLRADEWEFAKAEYLHAFSLFRAAPFKKMYDNWSEDMRRVILNQLENAALEFAKFCLSHRNGKNARRVLEKVSEIIPCSDEVKRSLDSLVVG